MLANVEPHAAWPTQWRGAMARAMPTATNIRPPEDAIIVISRVVDAPRELVFEAFTDPKHLSQFWGPKWTTAPRCEVDLRVGGKFRVEMRGPDGATYPCTGVYREIDPPERLVYAGTAEDDNPCGGGLPPRSLVTMTFAEQGGKTKITIHTRLGSYADREAAIAGGFSTGWNDALDRLEALLTQR
jgi:uncharacterized protein YndB with AHSA1/START domain